MNENNKTSIFQIVFISLFVFFTVVGVILFASYKAKNEGVSTSPINLWGTIDKGLFDGFISKLNSNFDKGLNINYKQISEESFDQVVVEAIADGVGPDVILIPQDKVLRYINKIYPIPYENYPQRNFKDTFVQGTEIFLGSQGVLGLPFTMDPLVMYWNRDIFTTNQIALAPTTWADFPVLAGKLSKSDNNANVTKSTVALGEYRNINNAKEIISALIMQTGNPITSYSKEGDLVSTLAFSNAGDPKKSSVESALRFYTDYSNPKKTVYSWNRALPTSKTFFLRGDLAVYFGFGSEYSDIRIKNPNLNFDIAQFPQIVDTNLKLTFGKSQAFMLLKGSKNISSAYSIISYLTGNQAMNVWLSLSDFSPTRRDIISRGTSDSIDTILYNSSLIAKSWIDPDKDRTTSIFQNMIENITTGRLTLSESVGKANDEIDSL